MRKISKSFIIYYNNFTCVNDYFLVFLKREKVRTFRREELKSTTRQDFNYVLEAQAKWWFGLYFCKI